ncbi:MAG TPA: tetratricopeptide repeat protein [Woeseiaceae bacterium]|nr:tetratricopeptide repeat protein [Woeseiaceae bacterium]
MIWVLFGVMLLAAALVVAWPIYRRERRLSAGLVAGVAIVLVLSAGLYGTLGVPVTPDMAATIDEMLRSLEERLAEDPTNVAGWQMLGRSQMQLGNWDEAVAAFERAAELEERRNPQTLADLGEALLNADPASVTGRAGQLFESALALAPANQKALFYGGIAALERGDAALAADRWEALLAQGAPPEVEAILRERVAAWRGTPGAAEEAAVVQVGVALSAAADEAVGPDATVYIIARDPARPSPPVAAVRRKAAELPLTVALRDADSMLPGRPLSSFERLEIVARASVSGEPTEQRGDWFGLQTVSRDPATGAAAVDIVIGQQVN